MVIVSESTWRAQCPKVFVITLNWNGREWLGDCLRSVLDMDYPNFEVVVVDNGSTDGSVEFLHRTFPVQVVETGSNLGYARGLNVGLEYAAGRGAEYFLVMNNDTVIEKGALTALVETALTCIRAGFVTGKVYFHSQPDVLQTVGKEEDPIRWNGRHIGWRERDVGQYDEVAERIFVDDVVTLVDRRVYDEVGGYDPQFFVQAAEFDWQARAKKEYWRSYYTPKARLWHRVSMTMGGLGNPIGRYFDAQAEMVVLAQHFNRRRFLRYLAYSGAHVLNTFLRGLVQFNWRKLKPRLALLLGYVGGTLWLIHRRPATQVPWVIRALSSHHRLPHILQPRPENDGA